MGEINRYEIHRSTLPYCDLRANCDYAVHKTAADRGRALVSLAATPPPQQVTTEPCATCPLLTSGNLLVDFDEAALQRIDAAQTRRETAGVVEIIETPLPSVTERAA
jgi:hypothetical protein